MADDMSHSDTKSTDTSDAALELIRKAVLQLLPPGKLRDRIAAMPLDELRALDLQSPLWRDVRAAIPDPERRRLH